MTNHWKLLAAVLLLGVFICSGQNAKAAPQARSTGIGRLWNLTPNPITYEIGRTTGRPWSNPITLQPGKYHQIHAPARGQHSDILGLNVRDRFIAVRFRALGGVVKMRLPARTPEGEIVPNWFFVQDANSLPRLIQANGPEEARSEYSRLQKERPLTPQDLAQLRETLRANHVFSDGQ
jgi:hypothetical protein